MMDHELWMLSGDSLTFSHPDTGEEVVYQHKGEIDNPITVGKALALAVPASTRLEEIRRAQVESERWGLELQEKEEALFARVRGMLRAHPDTIDALRAWHDAVGWSCVAASEGQRCCVDELLADG